VVNADFTADDVITANGAANSKLPEVRFQFPAILNDGGATVDNDLWSLEPSPADVDCISAIPAPIQHQHASPST